MADVLSIRDSVARENGVAIVGLTKAFGGTRAIDGVDLAIRPGEFLSLLGPSGCGKTTLLRALAGLIAPDAGTIRFGGQTIVDAGRKLFLAPERRNVGMVFQDYALWPHLRVRENVAFPLEARRLPRSGHAARVCRALARVTLDHLADRFPAQLSGGQQQRVALARAIVADPDVILFDEPLSNLDAGLRDALGRQMADLTRELGATAVYVTHDQSEALSLSDRVAVMRTGRVVQIDTPERLYRAPADSWVAAFLRAGSLVAGVAAGGTFRPRAARAGLLALGKVNGVIGPATLLVPATAIRLNGAADSLSVQVESVQFRGDRYEVIARWDDGPEAAALQFWSESPFARGARVDVSLDRTRLRLFPGRNADDGDHPPSPP